MRHFQIETSSVMASKQQLLQRIGLSVIFVGWLGMLVEAWPVLVSRLSALQWATGSMIHLGAILLVVAVERRPSTPQPSRMDVRVLVASLLSSWIFDLSVISKLGK